MQKNLGLYIHIPFCEGKCPYCAFYSVPYSFDSIEEYYLKLIEVIKVYAAKYKDRIIDTIYFGGGTPSLLGTDKIVDIIEKIKLLFNTALDETTIEVNPISGLRLDFSSLKKIGVNRISIGMQSANEEELIALKRRHSIKHVESLINKVYLSGIDNVSLDLMCCIPNQTIESLKSSIDFCAKMGVQHISAYMLKIEEGTPFFETRSSLKLPDENQQCDLYFFMCEKLQKLGYDQYEISNFAKPGFESRHNLKYWNCDDYLGIGPAAHSLIDHRRLYYKNSFNDFYNNKVEFEGTGETAEEFLMLRLRLKDGITDQLYKAKFDRHIPEEYFERAEVLSKIGLTKVDKNSISLTTRGFLLSNTVIAKILWG